MLQKKLKHLQSLEVFNCELTSKDDYRAQVFELLEDVLFVDGFDREGQPAPNDDDDDQDGERFYAVFADFDLWSFENSEWHCTVDDCIDGCLI